MDALKAFYNYGTITVMEYNHAKEGFSRPRPDKSLLRADVGKMTVFSGRLKVFLGPTEIVMIFCSFFSKNHLEITFCKFDFREESRVKFPRPTSFCSRKWCSRECSPT